MFEIIRKGFGQQQRIVTKGYFFGPPVVPPPVAPVVTYGNGARNVSLSGAGRTVAKSGGGRG